MHACTSNVQLDCRSIISNPRLANSFGKTTKDKNPAFDWQALLFYFNQDQIRGKRVLELGAGTALPGLLCAKIGASKVFLSDEAEQANTIKNIAEAVRLNDLQEKVFEGERRFARCATGLEWATIWLHTSLYDLLACACTLLYWFHVVTMMESPLRIPKNSLLCFKQVSALT